MSDRPRTPITVRRWVAALAVLLLAGCGGPERKPHLFVISIDTLRADYLEPYGFDAAPTPTSARLAAEGSLFTRAVTPMGITVPVHATLLTGLMPRAHGVRANVHKLGRDVPVVAERLAENGYRTASILSLGMMNFISGLDRGFDHASDRDPDSRAFKRDDAATLDMALDWVAGQDGETPLFMLLHLYDVHSPHLPTEHTPMPAGYDGPLADGISVDTLYNHSQPLLDRPADLAALRALYAGEAATADERAGVFLDALASQGLLEDSVVFFLADHGQGLGENGYFGHGPTLEQTVLHVPLIIRDFRRAPAPERITETVGLIDVTPTILSLAGLPAEGLPGRDLTRLDEGADDEPRLYLSEVEQRSSQTEFRPAHFDDEALAAYFGNYKLTESDGETRVYRIDETWGQHIEPVEPDALHESLRIWLAERMKDYRDGVSDSERADLDDDALEALRSLGYIQ